MKSSTDFLGLLHDASNAHIDGTVFFEPRPKLVDKARLIVHSAVDNDTLRPSRAGKLLGMRSFMESGLLGRVGNAGQRTLIRRTFADKVLSWWLAVVPGCIEYMMVDSLECLTKLLNMSPNELLTSGPFHSLQ